MAGNNIQLRTEAFDDIVGWDPDNSTATVTANTDSPPPGFVPANSSADTVADTGSGTQIWRSLFWEKTAGDTNTYFFSLFVKKDSNTSRFPLFGVNWQVGGTQHSEQFRLNTQTGEVGAVGGTSPLTAPATYGVVDYSSEWWRVYWSQNDTLSNTFFRIQILPAHADSLTGDADGALTGSIILWGANITRSNSLLPYEPDPFYLPAELNVLLMEPVIGSSTF